MFQGARFKINRPATIEAVVQLLDMLDKVNKELQSKENVEEADLMEEIYKIVEEFQESSLSLMKCRQSDVYFTSEIEDKNKKKFMEVITLSFTRSATFPVTISGVNCNVLIDTAAMRSCKRETFYNQLVLPHLLKTFHLSVTSASGSTLRQMGIIQCPFQLGGHPFEFNLIVCRNLTMLSYWV